MSLYNIVNIKCPCGVEAPCEIYNSVNVSSDPDLKKKVEKREINLFKCKKCGYKQELVAYFLYHDMEKNLMIWVIPENQKEPFNEKEKMSHANDLSKGLGIAQVKVIGYDELFKHLKTC